MDAGNGSSWRKVFEGLRPEDANGMLVSTTGGIEVAVQDVVRLEDEFVMLRGRLSGQADRGRLFMIPYAQIATLYVNRDVRLEEFELFAPSVSLERKKEVAQMVEEMKEKAKKAAERAEENRNQPIVSADQVMELEELRKQCGFGAAEGSPAMPGQTAGPMSQRSLTNNKPATLGPASMSRPPQLPPRIPRPPKPEEKHG